MFYECYDRYGRYIGKAYTQKEADEMTYRANLNAFIEIKSAYTKAQKLHPTLSFEEFEREYNSNIKEQIYQRKKENEKSGAKWVIIILIITFLIFVIAGGN